MLEALGSRVMKLVRIRLGPLSLEGLTIGKWRELAQHEVAALRNSAGKRKGRA